MNKFIVIPTLLLLLGCQDDTLVQPDLDLSVETELAQKENVVAVKMIPFKGNGDYWVVGHDFEQCQGIVGHASAFIEGQAQLTHLGTSQVSFTNCWSPLADPPDPSFPYAFASQTGTLTAANGDQLNWHGSAPGAELWYTATGYSMGPMELIGGTGRFENAQGAFILSGIAAEDLMSGTLSFDGTLSSVGSGK